MAVVRLIWEFKKRTTDAADGDGIIGYEEVAIDEVAIDFAISITFSITT